MFFPGLEAARKEIGTLKASVTTLEAEKREHVQSMYINLFLKSAFGSKQTLWLILFRSLKVAGTYGCCFFL